MTTVTLGIDVGGTNTKIGFVDKHGRCLASKSIPTGADEPFSNFLSNVFTTVDQLKEEAGEVDMVAVGIGAPNANYYNGKIEEAVNLKGWGKEVAIADLMEEHFKVPVAITNDANAAALGEMKFGVAQGMKNFVVVTLGTGLGSGIIVNGDLLYGHDGFAGELGHINVVEGGRLCGCGRRGCLETYVSATGIKRTMFELLADSNGTSSLANKNFDELTAKDIFDAAEEGDELAKEAFDVTGEILGKALADTIAIFSPEAIVLFGGLASAGSYITEPTRSAMEENCLHIFKGKTRLVVSNLEGDNTAILGSSALAWQEYEKKQVNA
ncbi:ROK family protein [Flammeovirga aprica]|uniref:ROK family protein n=1 Tax=Flammeovirga aprica JL-4 TaxID=694437 RepID=A0A7X9S042_9BACT|nr:ROK family protein [Flammeovirga aprica]NME71885.1 ROK family protein [Flammeovirga aprica JL-4]